MRDEIFAILEEINPEIIKYSGADMLEEGIVDSLEIMEIATKLEEVFGIELTADDVIPENFLNKEEIIRFVEKKISMEN